MTYTYRCGGVKGGKRHQVTYKKPIEQYRTEPKCHCGGKLHRFKRDEVRDKQRECWCGGLPWDGPHRQGSRAEVEGQTVYCKHYEHDLNDELEIVETIRGAIEPPF